MEIQTKDTLKTCRNKKCSIGGQLQSLENFYKDKSRPDGYSYWCNMCTKEFGKKHYEENKEKINKKNRDRYQTNKEQIKSLYSENKEQINLNRRKNREKNKEKINKRYRDYYKNNKEKIAKKDKKYRTKNKERIQKRQNEWERNRRHVDLNFKIRRNLKTRLYVALKENYKTGMAINNLDCSIEELKKNRLEPMFIFMPEENEMMTWENYGRLWHIDHIIPLSAFDLTNPEQVKKACHYTNLRPMHWRQNILEGDRGMSLNRKKRRNNER